MSDSRLTSVRVVLLEPQDAINVGATVRAMKNMGVSALRLVRAPTLDLNHVEAVAHDTRDIVDRIERFDSLDEALRDCVFVAGFTARRRSAKWPTLDARAAAVRLLDEAANGPVALLFGREDRGLSNEALDRTHTAVTIPTTGHASLNLAQAVLVALYEMHLHAGDVSRTLAPPRKDAPPATAEQYERFFADAERTLRTMDFFKGRNTELIMRTVRSIIARAAPDAREIELGRAMAIELVKAFERRAR